VRQKLSNIRPFLRFIDPLASFRHEQRPTLSLPHSAVLHLQAFSASWRFTPLSTYPPCFIRDPLLGFGTFRGFPSASSPQSPLDVTCPSCPCVVLSMIRLSTARRSAQNPTNRQHPADSAPKRDVYLPANADQHVTVDSLAETNEPAQTCRRPQPKLPKQPSAEIDVLMCPTPKRWRYEHRNEFPSCRRSDRSKRTPHELSVTHTPKRDADRVSSNSLRRTLPKQPSLSSVPRLRICPHAEARW
jgi:hypothetical protein